ncbi:Ras-related protein Rab-8A [Hondaea fermentalgiana]|uniref:Ras-related protein Rab-8A n=1 Tax=Hondaea fermentalgiana TaxID=2315210 RepID=A0A2R5GVA5_9STRA|nr:Ras-related protein Rab-8A [Hondaea fermentalgiana]|eukprot:GBG34780.1 Ras-related protein Rab-8A [Hondaea fermentalgiana]
MLRGPDQVERDEEEGEENLHRSMADINDNVDDEEEEDDDDLELEDFTQRRGRNRSQSFVNELEDQEFRLKEDDLLRKVETSGTGTGSGATAPGNLVSASQNLAPPSPAPGAHTFSNPGRGGMSSYDSMEDFEPHIKTQLSAKTLDIITNLDHTKYNARLKTSGSGLFPSPVVSMSAEEAEEESRLETLPQTLRPAGTSRTSGSSRGASASAASKSRRRKRSSVSGALTGSSSRRKLVASSSSSSSAAPSSGLPPRAPHTSSLDPVANAQDTRSTDLPVSGENGSSQSESTYEFSFEDVAGDHDENPTSHNTPPDGARDNGGDPLNAGQTPTEGAHEPGAEGVQDSGDTHEGASATLETTKQEQAEEGGQDQAPKSAPVADTNSSEPTSSTTASSTTPGQTNPPEQGKDAPKSSECTSSQLAKAKSVETKDSARVERIPARRGPSVGRLNRLRAAFAAFFPSAICSGGIQAPSSASMGSLEDRPRRLDSDLSQVDGARSTGGDHGEPGDGASNSGRAEGSSVSSAEANLDRYDHHIKILLLGDSGVGKTSLMLRFADNQFQPNLMSTAGVDFKVRYLEDPVKTQNKRIKCQIWDTAGQERFHVITRTYYRGAHGIALVYDAANEQSFKQISYWMDNIRSHAGQDVCVVLFGNKVDLPSRVITPEQGRATAEAFGAQFYETSAKSGVNVLEAFEALSIDAVGRMQASKPGRAADPRSPKSARPGVNIDSGKTSCHIM